MSATEKTIVLRAKGHFDEGVVDAAVYPGEAIRLAADGKYDPETIAASMVGKRGLIIATEDALQGKTVNNAYAQGDLASFYIPLPGDHLNVLVKAGENVAIGDFLSVEGAGSGKFIEVAAAAAYSNPVPLTSVKTHDNMAVNLPATAANDDMALITGTPGTDAPTLQGVDFGGTSTDEKGSFEFILPETYRAGSPITVAVRAAMLTTVSDGTATVDVNAWLDDGEGAVGADLCETAAQSINSLTPAVKSFVITPTGLVPGDKLIIRLAFGGSDTGDGGVMVPEISAVVVQLGNAPAGQVEALESSGGALAAAGLIKVRVL